jgi:3-phenylpropionate/cinnamic acid dioxygenase small subunit
MSQIADSATVSAASLQELTDRLRITDIVSTLGRCLDERSFDSLPALFTEDATVSTPGGTATGHEALVAQARRRHSEPEGIQHLITNILIELDGDRASVRANLLVTFAEGVADPAPYQLGEVYRMQLVLTHSGWRISDLSTTPTWSLNAPPR